ncbi:hypothetical protein KR50_08540 [Jeotgalibacillus campisalis]|uniref:Uncharacterized protein n=1 Tax=Jeotgalibacillus campisalis TaxID=220754 RepID=A0A0C2W4J4_9BACL|nr:hypothetical protein KR50_08540 [Jeotgalibacillus campisalis]
MSGLKSVFHAERGNNKLVPSQNKGVEMNETFDKSFCL